MNNSLKTIISFTLGAVLAGGATWFVTKRYYENIFDEQLEPARQDLINALKKVEDDKREKEVKDDYVDRANKYNTVTTIDNVEKKPVDTHKTDYTKPSEVKEEEIPAVQIISEDDFGMEEDYEQISLEYYRDGILTDELGAPVENPNETVGTEYRKLLQYDDTVYVRNNNLKCDFEICRNLETFKEIEVPPEEEEEEWEDTEK